MMHSFSYRGFDASGGRVSGTISAESQAAALRQLQGEGLLVSDIQDAESASDWRTTLGLESSSVGLGELEYLTSELSLLLDSGVRIDKALTILQRGATGGAMQRLLLGLATELKQGKQLSDTLAARPEIFDPLYVNLVSIGEAGGRLPEVFRGLAQDLKFRRELRQKIISSATYPMVVAGVSVLAVLFIFNFVVPNLESLFAGSDELPWYTTLLLESGRLMRDWQWLFFAVIAFLGVWVWRKRHSARLKAFLDRFALSAPGLRGIAVMLDRIRFSSGLSLMLASGVAVDRALSLAMGNIQSAALRAEMVTAVAKVKRGESLSSALRQTRLFSDYFASLVEVGEESGQLAKVFGEVAERSRSAFSAAALRFTTLLEPLLILFMGLVVGSVVVVMMLSITSVTDVGL
jgi:type II secretory pathway component PulF